MGSASDFQSLECAQKEISCPATAQAIVLMTPTNGQGVPFPVTAMGTAQTDASSVSCNYLMNGTAPDTAKYFVPCHDASRVLEDRTRYSCQTGGGRKTNQCELSASARATVDPATYSMMGGGVSLSTPKVTTTYLAASWDAPRENAYCTFVVNTVTFTAKAPCNTPKKVPATNVNSLNGVGYRCY
jgi:hypothetical protein